MKISELKQGATYRCRYGYFRRVVEIGETVIGWKFVAYVGGRTEKLARMHGTNRFGSQQWFADSVLEKI